jgi:hypothetical protein
MGSDLVAIKLPTSGVIHVTDPHDEIEPQLSVNIGRAVENLRP